MKTETDMRKMIIISQDVARRTSGVSQATCIGIISGLKWVLGDKNAIDNATVKVLQETLIVDVNNFCAICEHHRQDHQVCNTDTLDEPCGIEMSDGKPCMCKQFVGDDE